VLGSGRAEHGIEGAGGKRFSPHDRDLVSILEDQQRQIQDLATTVLEQQKESRRKDEEFRERMSQQDIELKQTLAKVLERLDPTANRNNRLWTDSLGSLFTPRTRPSASEPQTSMSSRG